MILELLIYAYLLLLYLTGAHVAACPLNSLDLHITIYFAALEQVCFFVLIALVMRHTRLVLLVDATGVTTCLC